LLVECVAKAALAVREAAAVYSIFQECLLWVRKETEKGVGVTGPENSARPG